MNNKIFAKAPNKDGYLFWERSRWKFHNSDGDLEDAYTELANLIKQIMDIHFGYRYMVDVVVRAHDNYGDTYNLYCTCEEDGWFTAAWDWMEVQDKMYFDWLVPFDELLDEVNTIIMD